MNGKLLFLLLLTSCAATPTKRAEQRDRVSKGPWSEVPSIEMPTADASIPIGLLRDVAEAFLKRPGSKTCDPLTKRPIVGMSKEYCSTIYVAGNRDSLSWRVTEPVEGEADSCRPSFWVEDEDYPASQLWAVGYIHNHPCAAPPSSKDLALWPTDAFDPYVAMAEVRLTPGNPSPALHGNTIIEMASALIAERQDGTRLFLRYFTTGEVQQWSEVSARWVSLGRCAPRVKSPFTSAPQCDNGPLRLLRESGSHP
jgi:hypothetical protein